jgi:SAM-dependent methyltransferase
MRPGLRRAVARSYRITARPPDPEELVEVAPGLTVPQFALELSKSAQQRARLFRDRLPAQIDLRERSVLVLGRGAGHLAIELAQSGAHKVVALDLTHRLMKLSALRLENEPPRCEIELRPFRGNCSELDDDKFGVIFAVDPFRQPRPASQPQELVAELASRLEDGGSLGIGIRAPWMSPYGGNTDSRLPWAHLIFPEPVIFEEFRRVRRESQARSFADVGIHRITLARFRAVMAGSGLECVAVKTNVGDGMKLRLFRTLSRVGPLEELFTQNIYGVWRRPLPGRPLT